MHLSDAEWTVMSALWERSPASARDVLERVERGTDWSYSTVRTLLGRLVEKEAVRVRMRGNQGLYDPIVTRGKARRSAVRSLVDRAFDGAFGTLLQHLVAEEKLSKKDRERLAAMLEEIDRGETGA